MVAVPVIAQGIRFPDVPADHPRRADIESVASRGWFIGKKDGTYDPEAVITPGQMASVIGRALPDGTTRAEFASLLLVANRWAEDGKPVFTPTTTTTTTRAPTTTTTRAPTTTIPSSVSDRIADRVAGRQALNALKDSPIWNTLPAEVNRDRWPVEQVEVFGEDGLDDLEEMLREAKRINQEWAAEEVSNSFGWLMGWADGVYDRSEFYPIVSERQRLKDAAWEIRSSLGVREWAAYDFLQTFR